MWNHRQADGKARHQITDEVVRVVLGQPAEHGHALVEDLLAEHLLVLASAPGPDLAQVVHCGLFAVGYWKGARWKGID